ncbi:hypothetical protein [Marinobacterium mangrovicola]|uniref:Uncharacterized protein n=1 Tax=Marinobacterium mangrovicola TaxID=1476959 RepID=A0A4R1GBB2_9GAMM|nr:hypothetical protein [Marinobacterium mangrovicola]TCK02939.1 hypothetical protein CLV83_3992 [Marinobacterium mangrovicola]
MTVEIKEAIIAGIIGGVIAGGLSMLANHFLVPFPQTSMDNTVGHGITGLVSGLLSGFIGVMVALKKAGNLRQS